MTDQMQVIRDDIAYMRTLADEGRRAPLLGGATMLVAGLAFGAGSLFAWAVVKQVIAVDPAWQGTGFFVALLVWVAVLVVVIRRNPGKPGASAVNNRVVRTGWRAAGNGIFVFFLALGVACWRLHSSAPMAMAAPFVLIAYGIAWALAAAMSDIPWLKWVSLGSFAGAVLMGALAGSAEQYLAYAAALVLLAAVPGYALMRQEPSATV